MASGELFRLEACERLKQHLHLAIILIQSPPNNGDFYLRRLNPQLVDWLHQWGDWRRTPCKRLGYPTMTQEAKLLASPGRSTQVDYSPDFRLSPIARFVERALDEIQPGAKNLLWWRYCQEAGPARIAEYLAMTVGEAKWQIEKAHGEAARAMRISLYLR